MRERVQTTIRDDLDPVRRQDAGVASPHTRIGFLPRSAPVAVLWCRVSTLVLPT
jgi:hypothetical protein